MKTRFVFYLSALGLLFGLAAAYFLGRQTAAEPPVFKPAQNPYAQGIFANGIIESAQSHGQNVNVYPEVSGTIRRILVSEGDRVRAGDPLLLVDDTIQAQTVAQQKAQMEAALAALRTLKAQPRRETLAVSVAQEQQALADLRTAQDQYAKQKHSYDIEPRSVSLDSLDTARHRVDTAQAAHDVARRQYELVKAGAWSFDIRSQEQQAAAASRAYLASSALLDRFTVRAPVDGLVLSVNTALGSYVSPQGVYDTYTQSAAPPLVMGSGAGELDVRCYIDEILIARLPPPEKIVAQMSVRGSSLKVPLQFVRVQPYVSPKIALSSERQERVDLRVLPVIFRFPRPAGVRLYPGQLVDVYVGRRD